MKRFYYGVTERDLNELLSEGKLVLKRENLKSIMSSVLQYSFEQAISQSTMVIYENNNEDKIVILELLLPSEASECFHLRSAKSIDLSNIVGYYIGNKIHKDDIYKLEASIKLMLNYKTILNDEFIDNLVCADETDIYEHINLQGIDLINVNTIMNESHLDKFINETFSSIRDMDNYSYIKVS